MTAPALLGALFEQSCRAAVLGPGRAAGAGEVDLVRDPGLYAAELVDELLELVDRIRVPEPAALLLVPVEAEAQTGGVDPPVDDLAQAPYRPGLGQGVCDLSQALRVIDAGEAVALLRESYTGRLRSEVVPLPVELRWRSV